MVTYTTIQGDTWDGIAYKLYEDERYMKALIEANLDYADTLVFSAGIELSCPELEYLVVTEDVPFWREDDDTEDDEEDEDDE